MITLAGRLVSAGFYIRKPVEASYIGEENRLSKLQVWVELQVGSKIP